MTFGGGGKCEIIQLLNDFNEMERFSKFANYRAMQFNLLT